MRSSPARAFALAALTHAFAARADVPADIARASQAGPFASQDTAELAPGLWVADTDMPPRLDAPGQVDARAAAGASTMPAMLLRYGLTRSIELQALAEGFAREPGLGLANDPAAGELRRLHGYSDISFGAKWRVRGGDAGWLPGVAWLADVETTTGAPAFRGPVTRPSLRATTEWRLPQDFTLGVMPGIFRDRDDSGHHYAAGILAATLGKSWTTQWHTYGEVACQKLTGENHGGSVVSLDSGIAYAATRALQFHLVVSHSLTGATPGVQGGLGLSARL